MGWFDFGSSLVLSILSMPLLRLIGVSRGFLAQPLANRWHRIPRPVLGGIGIYMAVMISLITGKLLVSPDLELPWGILFGSSGIFLLGVYDDLKSVSPPVKLLGQILAAAIVVFFGYTTDFFTLKVANPYFSQIPNVILTFVWLVGITNALNLLDNMDGLAAGLSFIAASFLSFFFWRSDNTQLFAVSISIAGGALGFLVFNFPPASIFMGDSGSMFLGFTLAALAIARQPQASNIFALVGVPTLLFLLPILDTAMVTFTRLLRGQSPVEGGRDHTSHRLVAFGLSERQVLVVFYALALISGILAATLESISYWLSLVLVPVLVLSLALLAAYLGGLKVVSPPAPGSDTSSLARVMSDLTYRRRVLEVILDFFLISIALYLAFLTRMGLRFDVTTMEQYLQSVPLALAGAYLAFFFTGVYRGVWRYASEEDLIRYLIAALAAVAGTVILVVIFDTLQGFPLSVFVLFGVYLFLGLAFTRFSFRWLEELGGKQNRLDQERVLLVGASDAGEFAIRWITANKQAPYLPVGIVNDDPYLLGRQIHNVPVLGSLEQIGAIIEAQAVGGVILTDGDDKTWSKVIPVCKAHGCWVRSLQIDFDLVEPA